MKNVLIAAQALIIVILFLYCAVIHKAERHNDQFVADQTEKINRLKQQQSHLTEYFAKHGFILEFNDKGYTVDKYSEYTAREGQLLSRDAEDWPWRKQKSGARKP